MRILAFDTANNNNDVAILHNDKVVSQNNMNDISSQAEKLVPSIERCLNDAKIWYQDLDLIATIKGPGNFTGVRIGFSVAKVIKVAVNNIKLITINSLEALAYDYVGNYEGNILVILDAKLDEFFIQEFKINSSSLKAKYKEPQLIKYEDVKNYLPKNNFLIVGSGKEIAAKFIDDKARFEVSKKEDLIKACNVGLLAQKIYQEEGETKNDIMYIRKPKTSKAKK